MHAQLDLVLAGVSICQSTSGPEASKLPSLKKSQSQASMAKSASGSVDVDPSRWIEIGATPLSGSAVALAIGALTYFTRTTRPPLWST